MARIKKRGLDYFPINTDFIHDRAVRRLMKREVWHPDFCRDTEAVSFQHPPQERFDS